eukprot:scaffold13317_cov30-Attheya_sp.AAC.1
MMFASLITKLVSRGPTWYDVPVHQQVRLVDVAVFHKTEENVHATAGILGTMPVLFLSAIYQQLSAVYQRFISSLSAV